MYERKFAALMGSELKRAADAYPHTVYGVWADGRLAYTNPAWIRMALDNGGERILSEWGIGRSVWDAIPPVLTPFYREMWTAVLETGETRDHEYECSSPTLRRVFRMRVDSLHAEALLVRHDLRVEAPHAHSSEGNARYRRDGYLSMCSNCRRTRRADATDTWEWIPELVEQLPERVTHGICHMCLELYYPEYR